MSAQSTATGVPRRLTVAYFVPATAHFAGIERVVHDLASGLASDYGDVLDVHVVYGTEYDEAVLRSTAYTKHSIHAARLRHLPVAARRVLRTITPDIMVVPQVEAATILWFASRGLGIGCFVAHLHGNPAIEESGGSPTTRLAFQAFTRVVARRLTAVFAVSPSLARSAQQWLGSSIPVVFAPNPVRPIPSTARRVPSDEFRFLSVGRLSRQKGQDVLIAALAKARDQLPSVRLTLLGNGPEEGALRRLAVALGIDDIVDFAGYATDPSSTYAEADCFVLASRWEGFGLVLIEALQAGLPIVASDCDFGPADIVQDARVGELVPVEDVDALASALIRAAHRPSSEDDRRFRVEVAAPYRRAAAVEAHRALLLQLASRTTETPAG